MRLSHLAVYFVLLLFGCSPPTAKKELRAAPPSENSVQEYLENGKIIFSVTTLSNSSLSYALYLPSYYSRTKNWPVLILFDAQARGVLPLSLYKNIAEEYGYIFMVSNNSKNGNTPEFTQQVINGMFTEALTRFTIDTNRVYTGGFSGGARIATLAAMQKPLIKGVLAVAAGFPFNTIPSHEFRYIAAVGKEDFNYREIVGLDAQLAAINFPHFTFITNGKHDWCAEEIIEKSLFLWDTDAMRNRRLNIPEMVFTAKIKPWVQFANELIEQNRFMTAYLEFSFIHECQKEIKVDERLVQQLKKIKSNPLYINENRNLTELLIAEEALNKKLSASLGRELGWWQKEVQEMHTQILTAPGSNHAHMLKRSLASTSLQCYMLLLQLLNKNEYEKAEYIVSIYKLVDPSNAEAWYFSATLAARKNNYEGAVKDLQKSVENGFNERTRLLNDAVFQPLLSNTAFNALLNKIPEKNY